MDTTKQFLLKKFTEKWIEENKEFFEDYQEICEDIIRFHLTWGVEIGLILKNPKLDSETKI